MSSEIETDDRVNPDSVVKFEDLKGWVEGIDEKVYVHQKFEFDQLYAELCEIRKKAEDAAELAQDSLKSVSRVCKICIVLIVILATCLAYRIFF